jgi:hypothetical protein
MLLTEADVPHATVDFDRLTPAHASETYLPEVFGRSDSSRFVVRG